MKIHINLDLFSHRTDKKYKSGWYSTNIKLNNKLGWDNFLSKEDDKIKFQFRTVRYYHESQQTLWNYESNKYEQVMLLDEYGVDIPNHKTLRVYTVIYRLPWITITNTYSTKLHQRRLQETDEFFEKRKCLNKNDEILLL